MMGCPGQHLRKTLKSDLPLNFGGIKIAKLGGESGRGLSEPKACELKFFYHLILDAYRRFIA